MSKLRASAALLAVVCAAATAQTAAAATPSVTAGIAMTPGSIACDGHVTATVTIDATNPPPTQTAADVVLLLDGSGSIGASNFNTVKSAAVSFVNNASISTAGNHIGGAVFASTIQSQLALTGNPTAAVSYFSGLPFLGGNTFTDLGLQTADSILNAGRAGVPKVLVIMTDGVFTPTTTNPAARAAAMRAAGVQIFAVGVGSGISNAALLDLAGSGDHVFQIANFSDLESTFDQILTVLTPAGKNLQYNVSANPDWAVSGVSATLGGLPFGTVSASGPTGFQWSAPTLDATTPKQVQITYTLTHTGTTGGSLQPQHAAALQWTDGAAGAQTADLTGGSVAVTCNVPPTANAGADQTASLSGSQLAHVTLDGTGSTDDGLLGPLTYTWSEGGSTIASGATAAVDLPLGPHTITLTVDDGQYSASDDVLVTVVDPTPPSVTFAGDRSYGILENVSVTCTAADAESGIASTTCPNVASGPALSFGVGSHPVTASATNGAGATTNAATSFSVTVNAADLCTLVGRYVTGPGAAGVANSLCTKISKGNTSPFENEVNAQRGKKLTAAQADELIALARLL